MTTHGIGLFYSYHILQPRISYCLSMNLFNVIHFLVSLIHVYKKNLTNWMNYKPHPKYVNVNTTRKCWVDNQLAYKCERGLQAQQVKTIIKNNFSLVTCTTRENTFRIKIKDKGNDKVEALTMSWHFFYQKLKKNLDFERNDGNKIMSMCVWLDLTG